MRVTASENGPIPSLAPQYSPEIIGAGDSFAQAVYRHSILPLRLFEAARIATAMINGCTICLNWRTARDAKAMGMGVPESDTAGEPDEAFYQALLSGNTDLLSPREEIAMRYARAMGENPRELANDEDFWSEIKGLLSDAEIVDLAYCTASWMGLGRVAHVLGIDAACSIPSH